MRNLFHKDRKKRGSEQRSFFFFDKVFNTWTDAQGDTVKFHTIVVTKGRQLAARFTYSRGSGQKEKQRVCISAGKRAGRGDTCVFLTREAGSGWLRGINCVSFYLRLHASWIQRRARKSGGNFECRVGRRRGPKRNASTLPQRHARTLLLIFLRATAFFFSFLYPPTGIHLLRWFIRTTTRETSCAIYVFRYRREQMVPRHAFHRFYDALSTTSFNRFPCPGENFHFLFEERGIIVGSYAIWWTIGIECVRST